jgi:DNA-binding NarL/FixJ family response regulator
VGESIVQVLVVDDFGPWRRFVSSMLQEQPRLQIVGETSDGLEAVQKARELQPDLILLDIGLPKLNGIEAARRIRELSPKPTILFLSENRSLDFVEEALRTGAGGYVVKSDAAGELLSAVEAVLEGKQFVSASLAAKDLAHPEDEPTAQGGVVLPFPPQIVSIARRHEVEFYSDDRLFLDEVTQFIGAALQAGDAAIVVATESHREGLLPRLQAHGVDIAAVIEQGKYIAVDVAGAVSTFMIDGKLDPVRYLNLFRNLIATVADGAKGEQARVAVFGESVHLLWAEGNPEAAIQVEKLANQLAEEHGVDILCGYGLSKVQSGMDNQTFQRICAEHSAVHSR